MQAASTEVKPKQGVFEVLLIVEELTDRHSLFMRIHQVHVNDALITIQPLKFKLTNLLVARAFFISNVHFYMCSNYMFSFTHF
jgi:hypothetical protein